MFSIKSKSTGIQTTFENGNGTVHIRDRALAMLLHRALTDAIENSVLRGEIEREDNGRTTTFILQDMQITTHTGHHRWNECPDCTWSIHPDTPSKHLENAVREHLLTVHEMFADDIDDNEWYKEVTLEGCK